MIQSAGEYDSIDPDPDRKDALVITFKDRYTADKVRDAFILLGLLLVQILSTYTSN